MIAFSIIIPTCNRNDLLSICLDLLAPGIQTSTTGNIEVIVTDDSKDKKAQNLIKEKYSWVRWIKGPERGPAANRNNGAANASGTWLIFIDDDCLPQKNLLASYYSAIGKNSNVNVFEGRITVDRPKLSFNEESPINENGGYLWSCNFAIKKEIFFAVKGFDEGFPFPAMEDVDFDYRLRKADIEIVFVKEAVVVHPWRLQKKIYRTTMNRFRSTQYFLKKYPELASKFNYMHNLRIAYKALKGLFTKSLAYKFRGFGSRVIFIFLQIYFVFYKVFNPKVYQ